MVFTQNPIATRVKQPQCGLANVANASGTSDVTLMTAGTNGAKVTGINLTSNHGAAIDITVAISNGSVDFVLSQISVPAGAGNSTINSVSLFADPPPGGLNGKLPIDNDGSPYIFVPGSNTITLKARTAVGSGNLIFGVCTYGDF